MTVADRDKVVVLLDEFLRAALHHHGHVFFVTGPIGSGKTTLLNEAAARGQQLGAAAIMAGASAAERGTAFGLLRQLIRSAPFGEADRREIAELTGPPDAEPPRPSADVTQALDVVCGKLVSLAARQPLVIAVDDVQYADDMTLRALAVLARRVPSARIVLVLSRCEPSDHADGDPTMDVSRLSHCHLGELSALSEQEVREVARQLIGPKAGERHYRSWWRLSGGSPLLVEALAADLVESRRASAGNERALSAVGPRYGRAVVACLHRGGPRVLRIARGLAVLGGRDGLEELLELPTECLAGALQILAAAGVTCADAYRHEVARAAVLADMDARERAETHRRAAEISHRSGVPATTVAEYLRRAGPVNEGWAVDVLAEAAGQALRIGDVDAALAYLRTAQASCQDERRRNEITTMLVRAEWRINPAVPADRFTDLYDANRRGTVSGGDAVELVRGLLWHGRAAEAREVLHGLVESAGDLAPGALHELAVLGRWMRATHPGLVDDRLRRLADQDRYDATTPISAVRHLEAARLLSTVLTSGPRADLAERAGRILRESQTGEPSFDATVWALKALTYGDQLERASWWFETVARRTPPAGRAPNWRARLSALGAEIALRGGDPQAARRHAREALELVCLRGWGVAIGEPLSTLVLAATMSGQLGEAAELLEVPLPKATFESRYGLQYLRARGRYHLATGNPELALHDFHRCAELMRSWGMAAPSFVPCRSDAAEAWLRLGRPDKARTLIEEELELCGPDTPRAEGWTLRLLAEISEPRQRPALLHRATDLLQAVNDRFGMAEALNDLAEAYRGLGSYRRAATIAGRSRVVAAGIVPDGADDALPAADATEDGSPMPLRSLSDAERRVASLAARGYSNREIADQLWITVSTVEQHLTRAFRKLEVSRRVDLPDELKAIC